MWLLLLIFLFITGTLYSQATRVPPYQFYIVPLCNERYHKISIGRFMTYKRKMMSLEEQNWTGRVNESIFLSSCINEIKIIVYYQTVIIRDNNLTCTALHDGLQKSNYFIYFAIMNNLCFYSKNQFEISSYHFFDDLKFIHNVGFRSTSIDACWPCSQTQLNTSSTTHIRGKSICITTLSLIDTRLSSGAI